MPPVGIPGKESGAMPKRHLEASTQEGRAKARKTLGTLKSLTVQPVTRQRYDLALDKFFQYLRNEHLVLPRAAMAIDAMVSDYLEFLWAAGFGRTEASNLLAALQDQQPHLRGKLSQSWRLLKAWVTHEVPNRAPPMPLEVLEAMVGYALFKNEKLFALSLLIGFHGLLRTGELTGIKASHVSISRTKGPAVVALGLTKGGKRHGSAESITLYGEDVCRRLFQWVQTARASDSLTGASHVWRKKFSDTLQALAFHTWDFRPYSLRRGGATHQFRQHGAFDKLITQGRWLSVKTARLYINEGLAVLAELRIPWTPFSRNLRTQYHQCLTKSLPPLEPALRKHSSRTSQSRGSRKGPNKHRQKSERSRKGLSFFLSWEWPDR